MKFNPKITSTRGSRASRGGKVQDTVLVTIPKHKGKQAQLCIRIGRNIMQSMRWLVGDLATVQVGEVDGKVALQIWVSKDGTHTLSGSGSSHGKMETGTIKIRDTELTEEARSLVGIMLEPFTFAATRTEYSKIIVVEPS